MEILGREENNYWKDKKGASINSIKTKKAIKDSDVVVVKFGEKYKQWNAAFDAGYASALSKSIIVIHSDDHQHALKEVDASAVAVAKRTDIKGNLKVQKDVDIDINCIFEDEVSIGSSSTIGHNCYF